MFDDANAKISETLDTLSSLGKTTAVSWVQQMLIPHVLDVFSEYDEEVVRRMIRTDYALVREETPPKIKQTLRNLGSNPEIRQRWEGVVLNTLTPVNILEWMKNPEEWLDAKDAAEQRERLRQCAAMIEKTPGGEAWLERQVIDLYRLAQIVPEDSTPATADD